MDKLIDAGRAETDPVKREAVYKQLQQLVYKDAPWGFIVNWEQNAVMTDKVHGFELQPSFLHAPRRRHQVLRIGGAGQWGATSIKRLLMLPPVLLGVTVIVFLVMALIPGDPAMAILGTYATPANLAQVRLELGLNHPLPIRYLFWLSALLHGNLGWSYILHKPVLDEVMARLGPTMLLAGASLVLCALIGIPLGIIAAVQAERLGRQAHHRHRARRCLHTVLLAWDAAHPLVRRATAMAAGWRHVRLVR